MRSRHFDKHSLPILFKCFATSWSLLTSIKAARSQDSAPSVFEYLLASLKIGVCLLCVLLHVFTKQPAKMSPMCCISQGTWHLKLYNPVIFTLVFWNKDAVLVGSLHPVTSMFDQTFCPDTQHRSAHRRRLSCKSCRPDCS